MPRPDIAWGNNTALREGHWAWRKDIKAQIANPDIDGLLTACLLHHLKGWPVIGWYDTQRLMLDPRQSLPLALDQIIWVDIDMCWPGARSLSQHVVLDALSDAQAVDAYAQTVNPSLLGGHARRHNYTSKYPFGTFQWAWWLIGRTALPELPDPDDAVMTGLAWMPDGGFQSVEGRWRSNCVRWATQHMPGSILAPLASTDPARAREAVATAAAELRRLSGVALGWRNQQFTLTRGSSTGPVLSLPFNEIPSALQALCDAITTIYGWRQVKLPASYEVRQGAWRTEHEPPAGWPESANRHEVVSMAVTSARQFCWTEPNALTGALGQTRHAPGARQVKERAWTTSPR